MTELEFSEHAKQKLEERDIAPSEVSTVLKTPSAVFIDVETGYFIAVEGVSRSNHHLIVVYVVQKDKVKIITIIDTTKMEMVKRRVEKGRWVRVK
ncbi:MAG: DUF4258 domain-containing protein [Halobacteriota archaeon]